MSRQGHRPHRVDPSGPLPASRRKTLSLAEIARRRARQELLRIEHEYQVGEEASAPWSPRRLGAVPVGGALGTR